MRPRYLFLLIFSVFCVLACSDRNTPREVSEDFIHTYYQRADQTAALPLCHGLAAEKLESEIASVREVRSQEQSLGEMPNMPNIEYEPIGTANKPTQVLFNYRLTIKHGDTTTHSRNVIINTEQIDGRWKVINFDEY